MIVGYCLPSDVWSVSETRELNGKSKAELECVCVGETMCFPCVERLPVSGHLNGVFIWPVGAM